jgi:hypothetical protein
MDSGLRLFYLKAPGQKGPGGKYVERLNKNNDHYDMLANYLTGDLMYSQDSCEWVLDIIDDLMAGGIEENHHFGNACNAYLTRDEVELVLNVIGTTTTYSMATFKRAVEEWYDFLKTGRPRDIVFDDLQD